MGDREAEKKAWEVAQGTLVAHGLNRAEGCDYICQPSESEPADVVLTSPSGKFKRREAQVVSVPFDFRSRDDKQTVQRVQTALGELLKARGAHHMLVGLILSGKAEMHGVRPTLIKQLADLIARVAESSKAELRYKEIYACSPKLAEMFHEVRISHHPDIIQDVSVDIPAGGAFPLDGRWIEEGIQKKVEKYGGEKAVLTLMLIIGVAGFVENRQVNAFKQAFTEAQLPFAEIWINTPFHGTFCLKRRA
jgi:hypothetical protein